MHASIISLRLGRLLLLALLSCLLPAAHADDGDVLRFGGHIEINEALTGGLTAAAGKIDLNAPVNGSTRLAAGKITASRLVAGPFAAAAGAVDLQGPIDGEVQIAAGRVQIGPEATVRGRLWIAAGNATVRAPILGPTTIYAGRVLIDSEISGPVEVRAGRLELGPNARIRGPLIYTGGRELVRDPSAQVASVNQSRDGGGWPSWSRIKAAVGPVLMAIGLVLVLLASPLWLAMFPRVAERAQARLTGSPFLSLLAGVLAALLVGVAIVVLVVTIVGVPVALLVALLWPVVMMAGFFVAGAALGDELLRLVSKPAASIIDSQVSFGRRFVGLWLGGALLGALIIVPTWGWPLLMVVVTAGTGALVAPFLPVSSKATPRPARP